jgi:xylulokinase
MYLGIDLGTSAVKAALTDAAGRLCGQASASLSVSSPHPLWSEQEPEAWWQATRRALAELGAQHALAQVRGIGLSGQMHGAVVLDAEDRVLRPAILWNDGRSGAECAALEAAEPRSRTLTGNRAMPGFTAPKLLWLRAHEPEIFARIHRVLLPKDWLRLRLTGEAVSDMSDAAGTLWLDVAGRRWSPDMLAATGLAEHNMPRLVEGSAMSGRLGADAAAELGVPANIPVAGGAGDNAAGAVGIGCVEPGDALLSLGTSGVIFVCDDRFLPDPDRSVHAFCHCLPQRWHRMSVMLSAGASLAWLNAIFANPGEAALLREAEEAPGFAAGRGVFLPYLSGERTPHNDPAATGVFFGLTTTTSRADLVNAVLQGVAFSFADGLDALEARGDRIAGLTVIGGGSRSTYWVRLLAAALDRDLVVVQDGDIGPALGAARLAIIASGDGDIASVCHKPRPVAEVRSDPALRAALQRRRAIYRSLYPALRSAFAQSIASEPTKELP